MADDEARAGEHSPRNRIVRHALAIVAEGGYDSLRVRVLSERAGVSSRTIYTYFPSLDSLLIAAIAERSRELYRRIVTSASKGATAANRIDLLIDELTRAMTANRQLTVALLRALLSGKPDVAPHVRDFRDALKAILANAITAERPSRRDRDVAELLESIWFAALIGWASGVDTDAHIEDIMRQSTRLLLPDARNDVSLV